jgi:uncharacterized protein (TIGR04222 family)
VADFIPKPPDNSPPGAAGALIDEVVHQRDIVATLTDLGRRGVITLDHSDSSSIGSDVNVTLKDPSLPLAPFEKETLNALFKWNLKAGETVSAWKASSAFSEAAPEIRSLLYQELVTRGYFSKSPEETRTNWRNRALRLFLLAPIAGVVVWLIFFRDVGWFWFPLVASMVIAAVIYLMSGAMPKKTLAGAEAAAKWRAFRRYLQDIERYDKLEERKEIFDQYLPYAIAFGLEESWVSAFAAKGASAPPWYAPDWQGAASDSRSGNSSRWQPRRTGGDWAPTFGGSWWDVTGGDQQKESHGGDGGGFSLPDWQGTSDHAGRALSNASNGLLSMFSTAGHALGSIANAAAESDWGSSSSSGSSYHSSSSSHHSSFGGGGSRGGSSGGGGRGFG